MSCLFLYWYCIDIDSKRESNLAKELHHVQQNINWKASDYGQWGRVSVGSQSTRNKSGKR